MVCLSLFNFCFPDYSVNNISVFLGNWGKRLVISGLVGLGAIIAGILFSHRFDFYVGLAISFFLGLALVLIRAIQSKKKVINKNLDR